METQMPSQQKQGQFSKLQNSVGISMQNFFNKFVFHQNSDLQAFYIHKNSILPSQRDGMTLQQINLCTYMMSEIIFKVGQCLKLPVSTTIVAASIAQYFFTRKSFIEEDFRDIGMGAMFLACKSEQTLRKSYQVATSFHYILKLYEGTSCNNLRLLFANEDQYNFIKNKVLKMESEILFQLGFQIYKLFDIPTRYISGLLLFFNKNARSLQIAQSSWTYLNDIYKTRACIYFPGQFLASAAVFLALMSLKIQLPTTPWWILMESNFENIKLICFLVQEMRQMIKTKKVSFSNISVMLQKKGFNQLEIVNVFPVPYFRKINMELKGQFKIKPLIEKEHHQKNSFRELKQVNQSKNQQRKSFKDEKYEKTNLERNKNKKDKHKHKSKHRKHKQKRSRSKSDKRHASSSSQSRHKRSSSQKQTPKIQNGRKVEWQAKTKINNMNMNVNQQNNFQTQKSQRKQSKVSEQNNQQKACFNQMNVVGTITKQLQVKNSKDLLQKINLQLKKHEIKKQVIIQRNDDKQEDNKNLNDDQNENSDEDDQLLAELIKIKRQNQEKDIQAKQQQQQP